MAITAEYTGTGGERVRIVADRLVAYYADGSSRSVGLGEIRAVEPYEAGLLRRRYGVRVEFAHPPREWGAAFGDRRVRRAFLDELQRRGVATATAV